MNQKVNRRLAAILAADIAGYSRLMGEDEVATVRALQGHQAVVLPLVGEHGGRVIDTAGDGILAEFHSVVAAVECATQIQAQMARRNADVPENRRMQFRIGVNLGEVIHSDAHIYGDGLNIAARLETLARPGGVCVSAKVREEVEGRLALSFVDMGTQTLKNIRKPVQVYALSAAGETPLPVPTQTTAVPLHFDRFELQPLERRLLVDGEAATVGARAFDVLLALAERAGQLVTKRELLDLVWPGLVVEENNLATQVAALRKILGSDIIATIPGRGYRITARLKALGLPAADPTPAESAPAAPARLKTNLPATLTPLIGRSDELAALAELIAQHRLVSIVGAGGMGKTLLAQHLLRQHEHCWRHGVCWVELATVADPTALPGTVAAALGLEVGSGDGLIGLCKAVEPLELLVVLDNAEHLLDGVARLAATLHDAAPGLRLAVTSQAPLKLAAERVYRVGALAVPQGPLPAAQALAFGAIALFNERAQAADARFVLTDAHAPAAIELCRALDGLALAIELAAARAPTLGVTRLVESMGQRLKLLTQGSNRAAPARHQTLRAALEWSHGLLAEREQIVFRRLAVVAGSADLELIQQVAADAHGELDEWAVLDALSVLVERSLVMVLATDDAAAPRYRLLDSPKAYARERLNAAGEQEAVRACHTLAMGQRFALAWEQLFDGSVGVQDWLDRMEPDLDNAREALAAAQAGGDVNTALAIAPTLLHTLITFRAAGCDELARTCEALASQGDPGRGHQDALFMSARLRIDVNPTAARNQMMRAVALARQLHDGDGDRRGLYLALSGVASVNALLGDTQSAEAALNEALELEDPSWPPQLVSYADRHATQRLLAMQRGDAAEVLKLTYENLRLCRAAGGGLGGALNDLVDTLVFAGDLDGAAREGQALLTQLDGTRFERELAFARLNLLSAQLALGKVAAARALVEAGWPYATRFRMQAWWADYLALLTAFEGRFEDAARLAGYSDAMYERHEDHRQHNEAAALERARGLVRAAIGESALQRLQAEGARLQDEEIAGIALALPDGAGASSAAESCADLQRAG